VRRRRLRCCCRAMGAASPGGGLLRRGIRRIRLCGRRIESGAGESGSEAGKSSLRPEETVGRGPARWSQILLSSRWAWVVPTMEMLGVAMGGAWGRDGLCLGGDGSAPFDDK
jgi:hypothetical protein